ncbi:MAG: insulinase family protein, partial [Bacteroidetes bacterium]
SDGYRTRGFFIYEMMKNIFLLSLSLSLSCLLGAQPLVSQTLPLDSSVHFGQLDNGLTYYVKSHQEPPARAGFRLIIKSGSLQEEADQLGLAHFVEHMAFNGTKHFEKNTLVDFIERSGSRFGADLNAYTSFTETVYKLEVQTDDAAVVDTALQILVDWAAAVSFDPKEVDKERGIIRSEWRSRLSSRQRLQQQIWPVLLQRSRYAERLPIGSVELIDTVPAQRLVDYYQRWYQPRRMAIIAVGDFVAEEMVAEIKSRFRHLGNTDYTESPVYQLDTSRRQSFVLATDPEAPFTQWAVQYQLQSVPNGPLTAEHLREDLCYKLYSQMLNKRLAELKEQAIQPFTFAQAGFGQLPGHYRSFELGGFTNPEDVLPSLRVISTEVQRVLVHGFTEAELDREKAAFLSNIRQAVKGMDKKQISYHLGRLSETYLREQLPIDMQYFPKLVEEVLANIRVSDLQLLSQAWKHTAVVTASLRTNDEHLALMPDSSTFYGLLDSIWQTKPLPYQPVYAPTELMPTPPSTPSQLPRLVATDTFVNITTYELANGIRLHLKPTDFKEDELLFRAISPGGLSLVSDEDYPSAAHAIQIGRASGLSDFPATTLTNLLADKQVNVGPYLGRYEEGLGGSSNQADLETAFQLMYLYFTRPRFDSLAALTYREKRREIMERIDTDPRSAFGRLMIDLQYGHHPRRPNTTVEELDAINLERAAAIYRERFANPADFQFVFVGNFSADTLLQLANRYLGSLPTQASREQWLPIGPTYINEPLDTTVVAGQTPKAEVQLVWHGDFPYEDRQAQHNFMSMRRLLNTRLREELREELGGVYGVRLNAGFNYRPDSSYYFRIRFNTEPEQADTLIQAALRVINELAQGQIEAEEVAKIQESQRKNYEEQMRQNRAWLFKMSMLLARGDDWTGLRTERHQALVDALAEAALQETVRRYLARAPDFRMVLLPEKQ